MQLQEQGNACYLVAEAERWHLTCRFGCTFVHMMQSQHHSTAVLQQRNNVAAAKMTGAYRG